VADDLFENPHLAAVYDALDPDRSDLNIYAAIVTELGAQRVLDVGCGTGTFALMLSERGFDVVGLDPAGASLDVARGKPGAEGVRWVHGDATALPGALEDRVDLAVMTANVAQAIVDEQEWARTLVVVRRCLRPGGHLVFESRRPERRGWEEWTRAQSETVTEVPGYGPIRHWVQLTEVNLPLVRFEAVRRGPRPAPGSCPPAVRDRAGSGWWRSALEMCLRIGAAGPGSQGNFRSAPQGGARASATEFSRRPTFTDQGVKIWLW